MKILIVDDNANNRMVLKLMLQDYGEEKNAVYDIKECENGLEAVNKANRDHFDIIFMDIMMPEMNGIEATKKIRARNKEVMIIAVSAVDDELQQKEILRNGAEDYVPKPIDIKVLNTRLDSYFALLKLRTHGSLSEHRKAANLYSNEILKRQTIFYVSDEEALAEFWEYYLLRDVSHKLDGLSDVVRATFALGEAIISLKGEPWIIVEGDNDAIYFTINRIDVVGEMVVKLIMKKNKEIKDFKYNEEKLSFKLIQDTNSFEEEKPKEDIAEVKEIAIITPELSSKNVDEYEVYNYMEADDLEDVKELLGELTSVMLILGSSDIEPSEVAQIAQYLKALSRSLGSYTESYAISNALSSLSDGINENSQRFQEIAKDLSSLSSAFVSDLQSWFTMTFYEGAPSLNFMDATIVTNTQTICSMLVPQDTNASAEDMDDIFDF